jgi:hypothetical protein
MTEKIQIFDLSGKLVHEFETDNLIIKTDISKLQNGIYTIRFDFNFNFNSEFINKRFFVQK